MGPRGEIQSMLAPQSPEKGPPMDAAPELSRSLWIFETFSDDRQLIQVWIEMNDSEPRS